MTTLLNELAERLEEKQTFAKLHVVGGACLALAYERDRITEDIHGRVDTGHKALEEVIREIGQAHGLPRQWLTDEVRILSPQAGDNRSPTLYESPSLIVTSASGEALLAMKLEASREEDENDIRYLLGHLGITDADTALEQHRTLFPDSPGTARARSLLAMIAENDERLAPPTPIEKLRKRWQLAMTDRNFPRYESEPARQGFRLTVTERPEQLKYWAKAVCSGPWFDGSGHIGGGRTKRPTSSGSTENEQSPSTRARQPTGNRRTQRRIAQATDGQHSAPRQTQEQQEHGKHAHRNRTVNGTNEGTPQSQTQHDEDEPRHPMNEPVNATLDAVCAAEIEFEPVRHDDPETAKALDRIRANLAEVKRRLALLEIRSRDGEDPAEQARIARAEAKSATRHSDRASVVAW